MFNPEQEYYIRRNRNRLTERYELYNKNDEYLMSSEYKRYKFHIKMDISAPYGYIGTLKSNKSRINFDFSTPEEYVSELLNEILPPEICDIVIKYYNNPDISVSYKKRENNCTRMEILTKTVSMKNKAPIKLYRFCDPCLNFNGRIKKSSVKNFQIVDINDTVILQFGRVDDDDFIMDHKSLLTHAQSFAICLSIFYELY